MKNENFEQFTAKEMKTYKRLFIASTIVMVLAILCILGYFLLRYRTNKNLTFCQETGLYRTIINNKVISYTSDETASMDKDSKLADIAIELAGDINCCNNGDDFSTSVKCSSKVSNYISKFVESLNPESDDLNLSVLFKGAEYDSYGSGESICYPYKIKDGIRYSKEWLSSSLDEDYINSLSNLVRVPKSDVPPEVTDSLGNSAGYFEIEEKVKELLPSYISEINGEFFVSLENIVIEDGKGYVDFFGDREINLMELSPSKALRKINPKERFTWILENTEVDGDTCSVYFSNLMCSELSVISVEISGDEVTDIKIQGFDS